jgi:hypothetical protein
MLIVAMELLDLTPGLLRRAASIKERIAELNKELAKILGSASEITAAKNHRTMSASVKRKIAAAQKARWAEIRGAKSGQPSARAARKRTMSAAAKAKVSAKMKAYWAAKKSRKK